MGATLIAVTIMIVWTRTMYGESPILHLRHRNCPSSAAATKVCITGSEADHLEHFTHLAGITAPVEFQNLVTYQVRTISCDRPA